ncbi:MAG: hypothetical protein LBC37_01320 [Zoogloeaceae bacterium]|nr:hypothetical protein [Zoogloeaceae bacterium]
MKLTLFHCVFLIFLTLKLTGVIDWSWWWVFSPLLGAAAMVFCWSVLDDLTRRK